jgi:polyferredoxin
MKKVQRARALLQLLFLCAVLLGLHRRMGLIIFVFTPLAFIAGNFFCGWLCPLGAIQELLRKAGSIFMKRSIKRIKLPSGAQRYAQFTKYLLALVILILVLLGAMSPDEANSLPVDAYQSFFALADGNHLAAAAISALCAFLITSLFIDRPYCNYLCVNSVEYALPSCTRVLTIRRNPDACVKCGACDARCPMNISVSHVKEVRNLQCINCLGCIAVCPARGALSYGRAGVLTKIENKIRAARRTSE